MITNYKGYSFKSNVTACIELICSAAAILLFFLPWLHVNLFNSGPTPIDLNAPIVYICIACCLGNILLKFYKRALWLSIIVAFFLSGIIYDHYNAINELNSDPLINYKARFTFLGILAILTDLALVVSILIGVVEFLRTLSRKTAKKILFIAGVGLVCCILLFGGGLYYKDLGNISFIVSIVASIGTFGFFICGLIGVITWLVGKPDFENNASTEESDVIDDDNNLSAIEQNEEIYTDDTIERRRYYYIGGGIGVLLIALICFFTCSGKKGNDLLPVEKPAWEKFVVITADEIHLYKEASEVSPQLEVSQEDLESDAIDMYFKWSDQPDKNGYVSAPYTLFKDNVLPVIEEVDGWYKVTISEDLFGTETCYISKSVCREVKPEPITPELLDTLETYKGYMATFGLQTEGKYKNICFISVFSEMDGSWLDAAVLYDGVLINPQTKRINTQSDYSQDDAFSIGEKDGMTALSYGKNLSLNEIIFDARPIASKAKKGELDLDNLFESIPTSSSNVQEVSYYFPDVDKTRIFTFTQELTGNNTSNNTEIANDQDNVPNINYVVDKDEDGNYGLFAEINNEKKSLDINGYHELRILDQRDYDGDGIKEALIYRWGGGNYIETPYIVYYDSATESFKIAEGFQYQSEDPHISVEEWNGKPSFRENVGIRKDRYVFEDHEVKLAERILPDVGKIVCTITTEQIFSSGEEDSKTISIDIDGNEVKEKVVFFNDKSRAMDYGASMRLENIYGDEWCLPDYGQDDLGVQGTKFSFLQSETNSMPDILVDDAWLYKYNGEGSYVVNQ